MADQGFEAALAAGMEDDFLARNAEAMEAAGVRLRHRADIYAALFGSDLGREVLEDMWNRYVNATRCDPGQAASFAFYREGMAQVVFDIIASIETARRTQDDG